MSTSKNYKEVALDNSKKTIENIFNVVEQILVENYGYDFSNKELFPNGPGDFFGHADAYADWVALQKGKIDDIDYEFLAAVRIIIDYSH